MTKKEFKKELRAFLVDVEWTQTVEDRIDYLLRQLSTAPVKREVVTKVVEKKIYVRVNDLVDNNAPSLDEIAATACKAFGITIQELKSKSRKAVFVQARKAFVELALSQYSFTTIALGNYLNRHHTSIIFFRDGKHTKMSKVA